MVNYTSECSNIPKELGTYLLPTYLYVLLNRNNPVGLPWKEIYSKEIQPVIKIQRSIMTHQWEAVLANNAWAWSPALFTIWINPFEMIFNSCETTARQKKNWDGQPNQIKIQANIFFFAISNAVRYIILAYFFYI